MIAFNAASQLAALGGSVVVQTGYLVLAARWLGVEDFGRFSLAFSIVQMLLVAGDLGLHNTVLRKIALQPGDSPLVFSVFLALKLRLALLLLAAAALIALLLPVSGPTRACLLVMAPGLAAHSLLLGLGIGFQAHGKLYLGAASSFLLILVQAGAGSAGLLAGGGVVWLGWAYTLAVLLVLACTAALFGRRIHPPAPGWETRGLGREFLRESLAPGLGVLFEAVTARVAITLVALLAGAHAAGLFAAPARLMGVLRNVPQAAASAVLPALAARAEQPREAARLFRRFFALVLGLSLPLAALLFLLAEPLIRLVFGAPYAESAAALEVMIWSFVPLSLAVASSQLLLSQGRRVRRVPWVTGSVLIVTLAAHLLLIPRWGVMGAAAAFLLGETVSFLLFAAAARGGAGPSRPAALTPGPE